MANKINFPGELKNLRQCLAERPTTEEPLDRIIAIEEWLKKSLERAGRNHLLFQITKPQSQKKRARAEERIMGVIAGETVSIDSLIDEVTRAADAWTSTNVPKPDNLETLIEHYSLHVRVADEVLLPPEWQPTVNPNPEARQPLAQGERFAVDRLSELIKLLRGWEVYTDDLIVTISPTDERMERWQSYMHIWIPRLNATILLCNINGEATFVHRGYLPPQACMESGKKSLAIKYHLKRIIFKNSDPTNWREEIRKAITGQEKDSAPKAVEVAGKVDVVFEEKIRNKVLNRFKTPEKFMRASVKTLNKTLFGVASSIVAKNLHLALDPANSRKAKAALGLVCFGPGNKCIDCEWWGLDEWKKQIKQDYPEPENWMSMDVKKFNVLGKASPGISILFGENRNAITSTEGRARIGQQIYGTGHACIDKELFTAEECENAVRREYPDAKSFMAIPIRQRRKLRIGNDQILPSYICSKYNIKIDDRRDRALLHAMLARAIYGKGIEVINVELWNKKIWSKRIRLDFPTPEDWMNSPHPARSDYKIAGKFGLRHIANKVFQLQECNPLGHNSHYAKLGIQIFGKGHEILECEFWNQSQWIAKIKKLFPTKASLKDKKLSERKSILILGKGLDKLSSILGIPGRPSESNEAFNALLNKVYGTD